MYSMAKTIQMFRSSNVRILILHRKYHTKSAAVASIQDTQLWPSLL